MLATFVAAAAVVLLLGVLMRRLHQPPVVIYLISGMIMGPHALGLFNDLEGLARAGELGVVLLLFFVGMEVSIIDLARNWRVAVVGTVLQIVISLAICLLLGRALGWPFGRSVLIAFVIAISSTAVVVSMLRTWGTAESADGRDALGILIVQDLALVPMLLIIGLLSEETLHPARIAAQVVGGVLIVAVVAFATTRPIRLPFAERLRADHELQVFAAFVLCFGLAALTAALHLSTALGAFVAGVIVASARETDWVHHALEPVRVLLVALFFVSVGGLLNLAFIVDNALLMAGLVMGVLILNTCINAGILRALGRDWPTALYVGSLLAQVGEFSFVLAAVGLQAGLVTELGHRYAVGMIVCSLLVSPLWVALFTRVRARLSSGQPARGTGSGGLGQ